MSPSIDGIGMTSGRTRERLVRRLKDNGIRHPDVLDAIRETPRHLFMDEALASRAYEDTALPIGHGQTISQPWVVARMTEALIQEGPPARVLEVGTGCGYQTAILARLVDRVYTVERIGELSERARRILRRLRVRNVRFRHGDGYAGWEEHAPYDGILVTAAPEQLPDALLQQLADGGRLVVPVGGAGAQRLLLIRREGDEFPREELGLVSFVPLRPGRE